MLKDDMPIGCQLRKCMWWTGEECAVTKISRQIEFPQTIEEEEAKVTCEAD